MVFVQLLFFLGTCNKLTIILYIHATTNYISFSNIFSIYSRLDFEILKSPASMIEAHIHHAQQFFVSK